MIEDRPTLTISRFSRDVERIAEEVYESETEQALDALTRPVRTYFVRCNTRKTSPDQLRLSLESKGISTTHHPVIEEALGLPVEGPFDVSTFPLSVVVDKRTAESVLQGANVYAPGIVDCASMHEGDDVTVRSEFGELLASGKAVMNANDVLTFKKGLAVLVKRRRFSSVEIRELTEFREGLLYPQSLAAMTTVRVLDPQLGETIVDMNCAPGGKLSHLSQLMENSGKIYGFDRNSKKISQTRQIIAKLGCNNVTLSIHDSRYLHEDLPDLQADRVLIDPPCSALGLRPKLYDFSEMKRIRNLSSYQLQFLSSASKIVKPGGTIVYSVCTFSSEECEQVVEQAARTLDLKVVEQNPFVGSGRGLSSFKFGNLCQRFHPNKDEIGFFIAKFERFNS